MAAAFKPSPAVTTREQTNNDSLAERSRLDSSGLLPSFLFKPRFEAVLKGAKKDVSQAITLTFKSSEADTEAKVTMKMLVKQEWALKVYHHDLVALATTLTMLLSQVPLKRTRTAKKPCQLPLKIPSE